MAYVLTEFKIGLSYSLIFASKMRKVGGRCLVNKKKCESATKHGMGENKELPLFIKK